MKIAIVGAGVSGLATAKVLSAHGHAVTIFEQRKGLGGVWERSRHYAGLKIQSPREVYAYADFDMPAEYPEFPVAAQILSYLEAFAREFGLMPLIRFETRVAAMRRRDGRAGWRLDLEDARGETRSEEFDHVVVCNGLFSTPVMPEIEGRDAFEAAGGQAMHSIAFASPELAAGKEVVVVGFGKSALDIAYAARAAAKRVTVLCRRTVWHLPYRLFGVLPAKSLSYSRGPEFWFGRKQDGFEGFVHRRLPFIPQLYWLLSELVIAAHTGMLSKRLRPPFSLRESMGLSTGFGFTDNLRALRDGSIGVAKGEIDRLSPQGVVLKTGEVVPAQLVVFATGFAQDLSILSPADRAKLEAPNGDFRLYRHIVAPGLEDLTFNGYNGTTAVPLTSQVAAHWIAHWLDGTIARPDIATMNARIDEDLAWRRAHMKGSDRFGHFAWPFNFGYFDAMLADMGLPPADAGRPAVARFTAILDPKDYAFLNETRKAGAKAA